MSSTAIESATMPVVQTVQNTVTQVSVSRTELQKAIKYFKAIAIDKSNSYVTLISTGEAVRLHYVDRVLSAEITLTLLSGDVTRCNYPLKQLSDVVSKLRSDTVELSADSIVSDGMQFTIPRLDIEYRNTPSIEYQQSAMVNHKQLVPRLKQVMAGGGVSDQSPRNYGTVVLFDLDNHCIVGTDGYRLSKADCGISLPNFSISARACKAIASLPVTSAVWNYSDQYHGNCITVATTTHILSVRLSAVKYPNYVAVLPATPNVCISVPEFSNQLKALLALGDKAKLVTLSVSEVGITVSSKQGQFTIPNNAASGRSVKARLLNGAFLLASMHSDTVELRFIEDAIGDVTQVYSGEAQTVIVSCRGDV